MPNNKYNHIKEEIKLQGKTQQQMADLLGMGSHAGANLMLNGKQKWTDDQIAKVCQWLGKTIQWFYEGGSASSFNEPLSGVQKGRKSLDAALTLWFADQDIEAIAKLAEDAYKTMRSHKITGDETAESLIYSCILMLRQKGLPLSEKEEVFAIELAVKMPRLFKDGMREFITQRFKVGDSKEIGKLLHSEFFNLMRNNKGRRDDK